MNNLFLIYCLFITSIAHATSGGGLGGGMSGSFPSNNFIIRKALRNDNPDWKDLGSDGAKLLITALGSGSAGSKEDRREVAQVILRSALLDNTRSGDVMDIADWWSKFADQEYAQHIPSATQCAGDLGNKRLDQAVQSCGLGPVGITLKGGFLDDLGIQSAESIDRTLVNGKPYLQMSAEQLNLILTRAARRIPIEFKMQQGKLNDDPSRDYAIVLAFRVLAQKNSLDENARDQAVSRWVGDPSRFWFTSGNAGFMCADAIREARADDMDKNCGFMLFPFKSFQKPVNLR